MNKVGDVISETTYTHSGVRYLRRVKIKLEGIKTMKFCCWNGNINKLGISSNVVDHKEFSFLHTLQSKSNIIQNLSSDFSQSSVICSILYFPRNISFAVEVSLKMKHSWQ